MRKQLKQKAKQKPSKWLTMAQNMKRNDAVDLEAEVPETDVDLAQEVEIVKAAEVGVVAPAPVLQPHVFPPV